MKKVAYIILILLPLTILSQNKWELTHNVDGQHPNNFEVIDSNYVNIFFSTGSNFKYIYNSRDQGKTWKLIYATNIYIDDYGMSCPDTNSFFLYFSKGTIYKSVNNGKDVEKIYLDTNITYQIRNLKMLNQEIGVACNTSFLVTKDGWKSYNYEKFWQKNDSVSFTFYYPYFKNDSIVTCIVGNSRGKRGGYFCEFNINTFEYKLNWMGTRIGTSDMFKVNDKIIFTCGKSDLLSGGSGNDGIAKSTNGGKTWRRVLDLYSDDSKFNRTDHQPPEFGLQSIAFKDSLSGIAVGQFGKIVYTYDGGESWIYESQLPDSLGEPNTMKVRYAGSVPIIATYHGQIYRMVEDNLAPKPEDTLTISGRVWEGNKGQPGIPIVLGYRVTMTDSNGYYKFTRVAKGNYVVRAVNKYFDKGDPKYYYKPFNYIPQRYDFYLTSDTSAIDFNAIDLRTFYSVSGEIVTSGGEGLKDIPLTIGDSTTTSTADGKFLFPKIEQKRTYEMIPYSKEYKFTPWAYSINIDKDIDTFRFVATPITSVEENEEGKSSIEISPNPATEYITINSPSIKRGQGGVLELNDVITIEIYDVMGVLIHSTPVETNTSTTLSNRFSSLQRIDISNLSPGVYFLKIVGCNGACSIVEKFVKM